MNWAYTFHGIKAAAAQSLRTRKNPYDVTKDPEPYAFFEQVRSDLLMLIDRTPDDVGDAGYILDVAAHGNPTHVLSARVEAKFYAKGPTS